MGINTGFTPAHALGCIEEISIEGGRLEILRVHAENLQIDPGPTKLVVISMGPKFNKDIYAITQGISDCVGSSRSLPILLWMRNRHHKRLISAYVLKVLQGGS